MSIIVVLLILAVIAFAGFVLLYEYDPGIGWICLIVGFVFIGVALGIDINRDKARSELCSQEGGSYIRGKCLDIKTIDLN